MRLEAAWPYGNTFIGIGSSVSGLEWCRLPRPRLLCCRPMD